MAQVTDATIGHLADLIPSWERSLRAANKEELVAQLVPAREDFRVVRPSHAATFELSS